MLPESSKFGTVAPNTEAFIFIFVSVIESKAPENFNFAFRGPDISRPRGIYSLIIGRNFFSVLMSSSVISRLLFAGIFEKLNSEVTGPNMPPIFMLGSLAKIAASRFTRTFLSKPKSFIPRFIFCI